MGKVWNIPAGTDFLQALAQGLIQRTADDRVALSRMLVLLPTRRACRGLTEAFLRVGDGAAMILPRMIPVGEPDEESLLLEAGQMVAPAISLLERRFVLAQCVQQAAIGMTGQESRESRKTMSLAQAFALADALAQLLDDMASENLALDRLHAIVPDMLAEHWQHVARFLAILQEIWPKYLKKRGMMDGVLRRNALIDAQIAAWQQTPPTMPILVAGVTGSLPAIAQMMAAIHAMPNGEIVLPALDGAIDSESWDALDPCHPQAVLKNLLARLRVQREAVTFWPGTVASPRSLLWREALRPAETSKEWRQSLGNHTITPDMLTGLRVLECADPQEESLVCALILRQTLETPQQTASLVTPDRDLGRRVAAHLQRWGIQIDDSSGTPLRNMRAGLLLSLSLAMVSQDFAPVAVLAALKHSDVALGDRMETTRGLVRTLEIQVLRGLKPLPGLAGLRLAQQERMATHPHYDKVTSLLDRLEIACAGFAAMPAEIDVNRLIAAHVTLVEALAATDTASGASRFWRGQDGEAASKLLQELQQAQDVAPLMSLTDYAALLQQLLMAVPVRPLYGLHPRLTIRGPLEARLSQSDVVILGGLNEGVWPRQPPPDPFLSRPMRAQIGLPSPETEIGYSAHDFYSNAMAPRVYLTRAIRDAKDPTIPSRWLERLDAVVVAAEISPEILAEPIWQSLAARLDEAAIQAREQPAPQPPLTARPTRLSVSDIELLRRDPYALYARKILRLRPLDALEKPFDVAELGTIFHAVLENITRFFLENPTVDIDALTVEAETCRDAELAKWREYPDILALVRPRLERLCGWFVEKLWQDREEGRVPLAIEVKGSAELEGVTLTAKADRMDVLADGNIAILDYKTGQKPSAKDVESGLSPQLPLEAVMVNLGGFAGITPPVVSLEYWAVKGNEKIAAINSAYSQKTDLQAAIAQAETEIRTDIIRYQIPDTPYLSQPVARNIKLHSPSRDYAHLARVREWRVLEDETPDESDFDGEDA